MKKWLVRLSHNEFACFFLYDTHCYLGQLSVADREIALNQFGEKHSFYFEKVCKSSITLAFYDEDALARFLQLGRFIHPTLGDNFVIKVKEA